MDGREVDKIFRADRTGFEPAISAVTGQRFEPLSYRSTYYGVATFVCSCGWSRTTDLGLTCPPKFLAVAGVGIEPTTPGL